MYNTLSYRLYVRYMSNTQSPCANACCNPQHFTLTTMPLENPR